MNEKGYDFRFWAGPNFPIRCQLQVELGPLRPLCGSFTRAGLLFGATVLGLGQPVVDQQSAVQRRSWAGRVAQNAPCARYAVRRSRPRNTRLVQVHTPVQVQPCRAACLIRRAEPARQQHERLRNEGRRRSADTYCNIIDGKHGGYGPAPIVSAGMLVVPYVLGGDVNKRKR